MTAVRWGLLSTASIGRLVVRATRRSAVPRFVAVASRDRDRARQFAGELDLELAFASYEALLAADGVDAVPAGPPAGRAGLNRPGTRRPSRRRPAPVTPAPVSGPHHSSPEHPVHPAHPASPA